MAKRTKPADNKVENPPPPQQQRSKEKLARIINAGYEIAAEEGFEATTLAKIAKRAGVATSTVYTRFQDKEALLHALHIAATERSRTVIAEAYHPTNWENRPLRVILVDIIEMSMQITEQMAGFQKACYQRALSDSVFAAREAVVRRELLLKTRELFDIKKHEIGHPRPEVAAEFFVALYVSVITEHVMARTFPMETLDTQQLGRELHEACVRYLRLKE